MTSGTGSAERTPPDHAGATAWAEKAARPFRMFVAAEASGSVALVAAVVVAVVWATVDSHSYESLWHTHLSVVLGRHGIHESLRTWVNSGLMTLFFFVVGLEARREFDLGDLRERHRFLLPCAAGVAGMVVPTLIYLVVLHGTSGAHAWGVAMSTDTALALGVLGAVGRHVPDRVRVFLLTVFVVDDVLALVVVTVFYSDHLRMGPLVVACAVALVLVLSRRTPFASAALVLTCVVVAWVALLASGVDPIVVGLAVGLGVSAYVPSRTDLERASSLFVRFREQPTAELARSATTGLTRSVSPNLRLQSRLLPWTTYLVVPLFALANAGVDLSGSFLREAFRSPVTLGIIVAYVVGKPIGVIGASWAVERLTSRRVRPSVGWAAVAGSGTLAGIGFTVSFIVAARALQGTQLAEAKLGVLTAGVLSALVTAGIYAVTARLPTIRRAGALLGAASTLVDLYPDVDPRRDHVRGPADAPVTLVEYGDLQCPHCGKAEPVVRQLLEDEELRYVWRHLPLTEVHPDAQLAAEAVEAAGAQGMFWEMHDELLVRQEELRLSELVDHADRLGLDVERFRDDLTRHRHAGRVARDVESADFSGVAGTPTFFVNGERHHGAYDLASLSKAISTARARALLRA